jgi:Fanconi anemia group M protein
MTLSQVAKDHAEGKSWKYDCLSIGEMMDELEKSWNDELAIHVAKEFISNRPKIDHREYEKIRHLMIEEGWRVVEIEAGDYSMPIVGQEDIVMVERKANDFIGGVIDKGLHLQLKRMVAENPNAMHYLLIVDKTLTEVIAHGVERQIYPNQILGFVGSLISHGFYPLFTGSTEATAKLLDVVRRKVFELNADEAKKPVHHKVQMGGATIVTFPGVDEKLGKALVDRFRTIENLCKQDVDSLCQIEGIGKKKAQKIFDYLHNDLSTMNKVSIPKLPGFTSERKFGGK